MTRPLAFPSFVTGPKDDLAAPDIYKLVDGTPINKIVPFQAVDAFQEKKMDLLAGAKGMLGDIKKGMTLANNLKNINLKGDPLSQLANGNKALGMLTKALPPSMSGLAKGLGTYATGMMAGVKEAQGYIAKINGIKQTLKNGTDLAKISVIGNMINSVSCDTSVFSAEDRRATAGAYAGVIGVAMESGLQGAFGAVLKCEGNVGILNQVASACLPGTIMMSDLTSLGDMANKLRPGTIKGLNPGIIGDFNKMFSLPQGASSSSMGDMFSSATSTFSAIDPGWNVSSFGGEQIGSLTCVMGASSDFERMMTTSIMTNQNPGADDYLMLAAVGEKPTDVKAELVQQFPMMTSLEAGPPAATVTPAVLAPAPMNSSWSSGGSRLFNADGSTIQSVATTPTVTTPPAPRPPPALTRKQKDLIEDANDRNNENFTSKPEMFVMARYQDRKISTPEYEAIRYALHNNLTWY